MKIALISENSQAAQNGIAILDQKLVKGAKSLRNIFLPTAGVTS